MTVTNWKQHFWTAEELETVRREYKGNQRSVQWLAQHLKLSHNSVKAAIQRYGLARIKDRRYWSPEEDERLTDLLSQKPVWQVAKIMKRSATAIAHRASRINVSTRMRDGWFTQIEVARLLGVDNRWVLRRIEEGRLRATSFFGGATDGPGLTQWKITEADVKSFIQRYAQELNGRNFDVVLLVDILAGLKPPLPGALVA